MTPDDLVEIEAIKRLKYAYLRCLDQKNWDEIATLFVEDATASYGGGAYTYEGRDDIVGFISSAMGSETMLSSHRVTQPEIDLVPPDHARATWALDDTVVETAAQVTIRGAAFYSDIYVKVDGRWLIEHTGYKRTYEEIQGRNPGDGPTLTASWWATEGRSELRF